MRSAQPECLRAPRATGSRRASSVALRRRPTGTGTDFPVRASRPLRVVFRLLMCCMVAASTAGEGKFPGPGAVGPAGKGSSNDGSGRAEITPRHLSPSEKPARMPIREMPVDHGAAGQSGSRGRARDDRAPTSPEAPRPEGPHASGVERAGRAVGGRSCRSGDARPVGSGRSARVHAPGLWRGCVPCR